MLLSFVRLAEAMWWIDVALTILIGLAFPVVIFTRHRHELGGVNGVMLQPFVAAVVAAASGGIVASVLPADRARVVILASCVISRRSHRRCSYAILGFGLPVALLIMALYLLRLITHIIPPKEQVHCSRVGALTHQIVSVLLPLGPCGQGAFGLIQLATVQRKLAYDGAAPMCLPSVASIAEGQTVASALYICSTVLALALWGFGLFWLIGALGMLADTAIRERALPFNLGWWGFTFPLVCLAPCSWTS